MKRISLVASIPLALAFAACSGSRQPSVANAPANPSAGDTSSMPAGTPSSTPSPSTNVSGPYNNGTSGYNDGSSGTAPSNGRAGNTQRRGTSGTAGDNRGNHSGNNSGSAR